jgi:succinoglycan biosynthesis protein ExoA
LTLSIIIPTLNERPHLEELLHSIRTLDPIDKEIIFVDGGSEDDTREYLEGISAQQPDIKVVHNPEKFVSQGFNKAFRIAQGEYLSLVGAHAIYPPGYFTACINAIASGQCDVAGGFLVHEGKTITGQAISVAMSSRFGVGNTAFRTARKRQYVDSVAFAVYDRVVFEKAGLFDEELVRNQDDEFHYRLNAMGLKILLIPELEVRYFVRDNLSALWKQYLQYGYYKPMVFKKVKSGMRLRHLAPPIFAIYVTGLPLAWWNIGYLWPLMIYLLIGAVIALTSTTNFRLWGRTILAFGVLHLAYGFGFLRRLIKRG